MDSLTNQYRQIIKKILEEYADFLGDESLNKTLYDIILSLDDDKDDSNDMAQSDVVRIALNLAYLPENEISDVRLDKDGYVFYSGIRMKNKEADS